MNFEIDPLYYEDEVYGKRLLISSKADLSELLYNIRAARSILNSFPDTFIVINEHRIVLNVKNPEYRIDNLIGDRKGVHSERGVRASFESGKKQGCKVIVIDLDMHLANYSLKSIKLSKELYFRKEDFVSGLIERCYIIYHGKAVLISHDFFTFDKEEAKRKIKDEIQKIAE